MSSLTLVGAVIVLFGTLICLIGGVGLIKLPDFFARTHAGGVTDTLGAGLTILGMIVLAVAFDGPLDYRVLVVIKLVSIAVLLLVTSPIAGHAVARAALEQGVGMDTIPLEMLRQTRFAQDIPRVQLEGTIAEQKAQCEGCLLSLNKYATLTSREQLQIAYLRPPFNDIQASEFHSQFQSIIEARSGFATKDFLPGGLDSNAVLLKLAVEEAQASLAKEATS